MMQQYTGEAQRIFDEGMREVEDVSATVNSAWQRATDGADANLPPAPAPAPPPCCPPAAAADAGPGPSPPGSGTRPPSASPGPLALAPVALRARTSGSARGRPWTPTPAPAYRADAPALRPLKAGAPGAAPDPGPARPPPGGPPPEVAPARRPSPRRAPPVRGPQTPGSAAPCDPGRAHRDDLSSRGPHLAESAYPPSPTLRPPPCPAPVTQDRRPPRRIQAGPVLPSPSLAGPRAIGAGDFCAYSAR